MCGRYSINASASQVIEQFLLFHEEKKIKEEYRQEKEVFPTHVEPVIRQGEKERTLDYLHWGVKFDWLKQLMINAREDKLISSPIWSKMIKENRIVVPATSYWEWSELETKGENRYEMTPSDGSLFSFAGLTSEFKDKNGKTKRGFVLITVDANKHISSIHDRQPAMIKANDIDSWLDNSTKNPIKLLYHANEKEIEYKKVPNKIDDLELFT